MHSALETTGGVEHELDSVNGKDRNRRVKFVIEWTESPVNKKQLHRFGTLLLS